MTNNANISQEQIQDALRFDPIDTAEKMMGDSRGEASMFLGLALAMDNNQKKERLLNAAGDTHFGTALEKYISVIQGIGFEEVLCLPFVGISYSKEPAPNEKFYVFFDKSRGILLTFDTYGGKSVNGGKFYYNIKPKELDHFWDVTSSGGWTGEVWSGDHDCRESAGEQVFEIPVVWQMAGTMRVSATSLEAAEAKAVGPDTGLPDGEYLMDSLELDKEHCDYGKVSEYGTNV